MKILKSTAASLFMFGSLLFLDHELPGYGPQLGWIMGSLWTVVHASVYKK